MEQLLPLSLFIMMIALRSRLPPLTYLMDQTYFKSNMIFYTTTTKLLTRHVQLMFKQ